MRANVFVECASHTMSCLSNIFLIANPIILKLKLKRQCINKVIFLFTLCSAPLVTAVFIHTKYARTVFSNVNLTSDLLCNRFLIQQSTLVAQ